MMNFSYSNFRQESELFIHIFVIIGLVDNKLQSEIGN